MHSKALYSAKITGLPKMSDCNNFTNHRNLYAFDKNKPTKIIFIKIYPPELKFWWTPPLLV